MPSQPKTIVFPVAGIHRSFAWQTQPPYSTIDAVNVRSAGAITGRDRGGSRPGLVRAFSEQLGSDPITGTISGTPVYYAEAGVTRITATAPVFAAWMVGMSVTFTDPNPDTSYRIGRVVSSTVIDVRGDASAERGAFRIPFGRPINCLGSVRPAVGTEAASVVDTFEGRAPGRTIYSLPWLVSAVPDWVSGALMSVREVSGKRYAVGGTWDGFGYSGSNLLAPVSIDLTKPYSLTASIAPHNGAHGLGIVTLYLRMDDASPTANNCVAARVSAESIAPGWWRITLVRIRSGHVTAEAMKDIYLPSVYTKQLRVAVSGDTVTAGFDGVNVVSITDATPPGSRFGMSIYTDQPLTGPVPLVDEFRLDYSRPSISLDFSRPVLFAGAYGTAYRENQAGAIEAISGNVKLNASRRLGTAEWGGRLFVADHDTAPKLTLDGCIIENLAGVAPGKVIKHATATFNDKGIDIHNDLCVITKSGAGGTPLVGAYRIYSVAADSITLVDVADCKDTAVSIRVERAPKVFTPTLATPLSIYQQTIDNGKPKGIMPTGCPLIAVFRDRIVLGGNPPHIFYFSRAGDPFDWNFGDDPDDPARATGGASGLTGMIGKPLTAICRSADDYLILGTATEIWALHGDPVSGGQMLDLSDKVGIVAADAWTRVPDGGLVFLSHDGLYKLAPGGNSRPQILSDRLPRELRDINLNTVWPILAYEPRAKGVKVYLVPQSADASGQGLDRHWLYELQTDAFWKEQYHSAHEPISTCLYPLKNQPGESLLLGCRDGVIRCYSDDTGSDDGAPIESKVLLGPFRASGDRDLIIDELIATLGESSGDVDWEIYSADSAEAAYALYVAGTPSHTGGTWSAGRNLVDPVRHRDLVHYLLLKSPAGSVDRWEMEEIIGRFQAGAEYRPL